MAYLPVLIDTVPGWEFGIFLKKKKHHKQGWYHQKYVLAP
jgi:hypothetical protein